MKTCPQCEITKPLGDYYLVRARPMKQCKECHRGNVKARYAANPEPTKARVKAWAESNPERYEKGRKARYGSAKEVYVEKAKRWAEQNEERRREIAREWARRNPETVRTNNRISGGRRRKRMRENGINIDRESWDAIMSISPHICLYCGTDHDKLTMDHFVPVALGGRTEPGNLLPCCQPCNSKKSAMPPEKWLAKIGYEDRRGEGYFTIHQFLEICKSVLLDEKREAAA